MRFELCAVSAFAVGLISGPAAAESLGGIAVGELMTDARAELAKNGQVKESLVGGSLVLVAGDFIVTSCKDRVWGVTRSLDPTFSAFVTTSKLLEGQTGKRPTVDIVQDDGKEVMRGIEFKWAMPDGTTIATTYFDGRSGGSVTQAVRRTALCPSS